MENSFYYILFSIILISILLSWIKSEKLINPVSIYVLWWGGFLFLSTFKIIGMRLPSERTYNLLLLSVAMFALGGITFLKSSSKNTTPKHDLKKPETAIDNKLRYFFYFQIICTLILLFYLVQTIHSLRSISADVYRSMLFTEYSIFGKFKLVITYFIEPALYISFLLTMTGTILFKSSKLYFFLSLLNLTLYSAVTLGRAPVFIAVVCLILSFIYALSVRLLKIKLKYIVGIALPVFFIAWLSMYRRNTYDLKAILILRNYFVWYLTGPFTALELFLDNYKESYAWDYSYVRGLFAGIEEILSPLTKNVFEGYTPINNSFHEITRVFRSLGGKAIAHNSHYTMLYEFIRDSGMYGVVLFSYLLGFVNSILFNNFQKNKSIHNFSLMIIIHYLSLMGITRWELRYTWSWLTIFGVLFFANKIVLTANEDKFNAVY